MYAEGPIDWDLLPGKTIGEVMPKRDGTIGVVYVKEDMSIWLAVPTGKTIDGWKTFDIKLESLEDILKANTKKTLKEK
jgi:hypothetical protein